MSVRLSCQTNTDELAVKGFDTRPAYAARAYGPYLYGDAYRRPLCKRDRIPGLAFGDTALDRRVCLYWGREKKGAIGFVLPVAIYGLTIAWIGQSEFGFDFPVLITSRVLWMTCRGASPDRLVEVMSLGHGLTALYLGMIGEMFARTVRS